MNAEAVAISSGRESQKYKHPDNEERDSPKFRTAEGAAAEMNSLGSVEALCAVQFCLREENADRIDGATLQLFSFGPNIAKVKASESSISEERNNPGAMTRETETENLDSADRGLTADVVFQGVAFEHFGSMTPTFVHSNLAIASGSFVASADASRGGKSTIIRCWNHSTSQLRGPSSSGDAKTPYQAGI
ncbi:hypothetical protein ASPTUDRAFT_191010 [Aspergillus tubingensis CBS 134.48]|uniref:Uncharacterized protein n=1 Tax=Aspergillus tubingensis (strain CBS 134.48) TaxID=767770 RepID=A0A1L9MZP6_ASPTC|nr:hypothetical protein ASPTUDRAFT_191010 [Aspergillus tubingensis CBS 134.48]